MSTSHSTYHEDKKIRLLNIRTRSNESVTWRRLRERNRWTRKKAIQTDNVHWTTRLLSSFVQSIRSRLFSRWGLLTMRWKDWFSFQTTGRSRVTFHAQLRSIWVVLWLYHDDIRRQRLVTGIARLRNGIRGLLNEPQGVEQLFLFAEWNNRTSFLHGWCCTSRWKRWRRRSRFNWWTAGFQIWIIQFIRTK